MLDDVHPLRRLHESHVLRRLVSLRERVEDLPLALLAPLFDPQPLVAGLAGLSFRGWFAIVYNIFLAGTLALATYGGGGIGAEVMKTFGGPWRCRCRCR